MAVKKQHRWLGHWLPWILAFGFILGGAVYYSAPARADQYDFLYAVEAAGIYYDSSTDMVKTGTAVCQSLRSGTDVGNTVMALVGLGWAPFEAGLIIGAAAPTMCPDQTMRVLTWARAAAGQGVSTPAIVGHRGKGDRP